MKIVTVYLLAVLFVYCSTGLSGCASPKTVMPVSILHDQIDESHSVRTGIILVRPFADGRKESQRLYIGETAEPSNIVPIILIPLPSGRYLVERNGVSVALVLTSYFADVLRGVGYKVLMSTYASGSPPEITPISPNAILEGEIKEFWFTPSWTTKHLICVQLRLRDKQGNDLLWEKEIRVEHSEVIGLWSSAAFENMIKKSITQALREAAREFISDEFSRKVCEDN